MFHKIAPFYLFYGENEFQKDKAVEELKNKILAKSSNIELNYRVFYADEISADTSSVFNFINSFPFMADKKIAVIKNVDKLSNELLDRFLNYIQNPSDFVSIVFLAEKPDFKISFFKYIKDSGNAIYFKQLNEAETIAWIHKTAKQMGLDISHDACVYLFLTVGNNLYELHSELQKLFSFYGKENKIGVEEIKSIISPSRDYSIFDLVDNVAFKRLPEALKALNNYLEREGKEKALLVLNMLIRQLTLLQKTKIVLRTGDKKKLQKKLHLYSFLVNKLVEQNRFWTEEEIEKAFDLLSEADLLIKSGSPPTLVLEQLITSLCS
ncbi:MAG: DNA polymerase III subunit delta [Deltaproteobacteria bacterium]|nr:MAG: DNA polymerase III subunit delta [Deltaproteobacteria bacterium]